jgi:glycosyltransferase involved in cell wall biosynthesis
MQILHVIANLNFAAGGPPVVCSRLAAAQAKLGHEVYLAYQSDQNPPVGEPAASGAGSTPSRGAASTPGVVQTPASASSESQLAAIPDFDRVRRIVVADTSRLDAILGRRAMAHLAPAIASADIVHIHGIWNAILRAAAAQCRAARKPYIVFAHGMLDPWSLAQNALKKKLALILAYRKMLDGAAAVQACNADEERLMAPLRLKCPLVLIPNGVSLDEIDPLPPAGAFFAARPELRGRRYILFLGRLHYKKGLDYLADAFAKLAPRCPDVDLVVAGPDDGAADDFRARLAAANLSGRAHVTGPIYGREKFAALVDAACFCLPSRQEGFSIAATEAMACGRPVVLSENCHFPEAAASGAGFVTPLDAEKIAGALEKVLSDPIAARQMGENGRKLVETRFTWPTIAAQSIAVYERFAHHPSASPTESRRPVVGAAIGVGNTNGDAG